MVFGCKMALHRGEENVEKFVRASGGLFGNLIMWNQSSLNVCANLYRMHALRHCPRNSFDCVLCSVHHNLRSSLPRTSNIDILHLITSKPTLHFEGL